MSHKRKDAAGGKGGLWITLGLLLIAAALALVSYNLYDALRAERSAWQIISSLEETSEEESRISAPAEASEKAACRFMRRYSRNCCRRCTPCGSMLASAVPSPTSLPPNLPICRPVLRWKTVCSSHPERISTVFPDMRLQN